MGKEELTGRHSLKQLVSFRERQRQFFENPGLYPDVDKETLAKIAHPVLSRMALDVKESGVDPKILEDLLPRKKMSNTRTGFK